MNRKLLIAVVAALCSMAAESEAHYDNDDRLNCDYESCSCISGEIGGNGILATLNFEHLITRRFGIRVGAGALYGAGASLPVLFSWFNGVGRKFELGIGMTYLPISSSKKLGGDQSFVLTSAIALRFQPRYGGFIVRLAATPLYSLSTGRFFPLFGGVSVGYAF